MSALTLPHYGGYTVEVLPSTPRVSAPRTARLRRRITAVLVACLVAFVGVIGSGSGTGASASWIDDSVRSVFCTSVFTNSSPDTLWGTPTTVHGKDLTKYPMTAYEKYGTSGLGYTVWTGPDSADELKNNGTSAKQLTGLAGGEKNTGGLDKWKESKDDAFFNRDETCGDPVNGAWSTGANALTLITAGLVYVSGFVFQVAYETSSGILSSMEGTAKDPGALPSIVKTLTDSFYLEFFNIIVMLAALWMGYKGLVKRQSTEMTTGAVWMIGAAIVGMFMLANPLMVSNAVNSTVMTVSEAGVSAIAGSSTGALSGKDPSRLCYTDTAGNGADAGGDKLKTSTRGIVRGMQCSLWESFLYTPWTLGQFGQLDSPGDTAPNGVDYIHGTKGQPGEYSVLAKETPALEDADLPKTIDMGGREVPANWARLHLDSKVAHRLDGGDSAKLTVKQGRTMLEIASSQTMRSNANISWTGKTSINRMFLALLALISAAGVSVMVLVLAMEMIILQIGLIILALLLPVFALVGVHPGFGRRVALMYLNTIGELAVRRIVLSVLLALMVTIYAVVLRTAAMSWMVSMIMVVAVSIAGIAYKNKIMGMFEGTMNAGGVGAADMRGVNAMTDKTLLYSAYQTKRAGRQVARPVRAVSRGMTAVAAGAGTAMVSNAMRHEESTDTSTVGGGGGAGARPKRGGSGSSAYVPGQGDAEAHGYSHKPDGSNTPGGGTQGGSGARVGVEKPMHEDKPEPKRTDVPVEGVHSAAGTTPVDAPQGATKPLPRVSMDNTEESAPSTRNLHGAGESVSPQPTEHADAARGTTTDRASQSTRKAPLAGEGTQNATERLPRPSLDHSGPGLGGVASVRPAGLPHIKHEDAPAVESASEAKPVVHNTQRPALPTWTPADEVEGASRSRLDAVRGQADKEDAQELGTPRRVDPQRGRESAPAPSAPVQEPRTAPHAPSTPEVAPKDATTPQPPVAPKPVRPSGEAFREQAEALVGPKPVAPSHAKRAFQDFKAGAKGKRGKGLEKVVTRSVQQRKRDAAREAKAVERWEWQVGKTQSQLRANWKPDDPTTHPSNTLPSAPPSSDDGKEGKGK